MSIKETPGEALNNLLLRASVMLDKPTMGGPLVEDDLVWHYFLQDWGDDPTMGGTRSFATKNPNKSRYLYPTLVVFGPLGDCVVYQDGLYAYCLKKPSDVFFNDLCDVVPKIRGTGQGWSVYDDDPIPVSDMVSGEHNYAGWGSCD